MSVSSYLIKVQQVDSAIVTIYRNNGYYESYEAGILSGNILVSAENIGNIREYLAFDWAKMVILFLISGIKKGILPFDFGNNMHIPNF